MPQNDAIELNKNILIAVDDSDNSRRAVHYVGFLLGKVDGVRATLLHVIPEPEEDYFPEPSKRSAGSRPIAGA